MYSNAKILFTLLCFIAIFRKISNFNFDINNPIVYVIPSVDKNDNYSSYFGYSVVLFPGSKNNPEKWIKIGAPRGRDNKIKFDHPGVVYDCPFMFGCRPIHTVNLAGKKYSDQSKELFKRAWIGGTMDISYKFERLVICAFKRYIEYGKDYVTVGGCYSSYLNSTFEKLDPLNNVDKLVYKANKVYYYGQGQAGFSAHFTNNENELILGAPGVYNWIGTAIRITDLLQEEPQASKYTNLERNRRQLNWFRTTNIGDATTSAINKANDLFGYAVTSGYFYGKSKLYYAASSPRSVIYKGQVAIFDFKEDNDEPFIKKEIKVGTQFGEYFGASITSGDINKDGYDDLIVGAPFHFVNSYNEGRIYTFLGTVVKQLRQSETIDGKVTNGQFGSVVLFLDDIDNDGYGDVAVGAPYEEEFSGVVYIFKGNKRGLENLPCQRIVGRDISPIIRGFGISISKPADMDSNGFKDIAIGAHLSESVVLLRSRPIVVINYDIKAFPKELKRESTFFTLRVCYSYTLCNESSVDINRTITVDEVLGRAKFADGLKDQETNVTLTKQDNVCENITILLKNTTNYEAPITVLLSYQLLEQQKTKEILYISDRHLNGSDIFCVRCPILDEFRSTRATAIDVPFTIDCGDDHICQSLLSLEVQVWPLSGERTFIVGSAEYITLETTLTNKGEKAYSTQLKISLPEIVNFRQIPSICETQNISTIICNIANPLDKNEKKSLTLDLDMRGINKDNYESEINIDLLVLTTSNNINNNHESFIIQLERVADITIYGKPGEQSVPFGGPHQGSIALPNFTHIYQVEKIGVSPLEKVKVNIQIPYALNSSEGLLTFVSLFPPEGVFAGQPILCRSNFSYIQEPTSTEINEKMESIEENALFRKRRQVEFHQNASPNKNQKLIKEEENVIIPNMTYFINCSMTEIVCSSIVCDLGPFGKFQTPAIIQIKMLLKMSVLSDQLKKDMILYSTTGSVVIENPNFIQSGNRTDTVTVSSILINETRKKRKVERWIIIISVIAGLLLLTLIILGLIKVGFFKRTKKEELKNLKAAAEEEDKEIANVDMAATENASCEELLEAVNEE